MSDIEFEQALCTQINRFSMENGSNTPDFILAHYLYLCLSAFEQTCNERQEWYADPQKEADATLGRALMSRATGVVSCPDEEYEQEQMRFLICDLLRVTTWEQALARLRGEKETVT